MTLSALLLAGGESRRMGVDKATLRHAGQPLWQRQIAVLRELQSNELLVSARTALAWRTEDVKLITDKPPSRGPLSGVAAGLRAFQSTHLLVLAIDLPQMTSEHLRKLWSFARPGVGVIPRQADYFEPLCAIYPAEAADIAEATLASGDASLQHFARNLLQKSRAEVYQIAPQEQALYLNMNTPLDLPVNI